MLNLIDVLKYIAPDERLVNLRNNEPTPLQLTWTSQFMSMHAWRPEASTAQSLAAYLFLNMSHRGSSSTPV